MLEFLKDEQGRLSSARLSFWATLSLTFWLIIKGAVRPPEVWNLLHELLLVLGGWTAGPRIMQYVASMRRPSTDVEYPRSTIPPS